MDDSGTRLLFAALPSVDALVRVCLRLLAAVCLGAVIGVQREIMGKPAGLRTHALVTLAAAVFTIVPLEAGMGMDAASRVIQGVATGIGFIGAGVILKRQEEGEVVGLTTAATVWAATAVGIAVGLGQVILAAVAVGFTWVVLAAMARSERWIGRRRS